MLDARFAPTGAKGIGGVFLPEEFVVNARLFVDVTGGKEGNGGGEIRPGRGKGGK